MRRDKPKCYMQEMCPWVAGRRVRNKDKSERDVRCLALIAADILSVPMDDSFGALTVTACGFEPLKGSSDREILRYQESVIMAVSEAMKDAMFALLGAAVTLITVIITEWV